MMALDLNSILNFTGITSFEEVLAKVSDLTNYIESLSEESLSAGKKTAVFWGGYINGRLRAVGYGDMIHISLTQTRHLPLRPGSSPPHAPAQLRLHFGDECR